MFGRLRIAAHSICSQLDAARGPKLGFAVRGDGASQILCEIPRPIPSKITRRPLVLEINQAYRDVTRF